MTDKNYFGYFDVLRFAAALWVVITHYGFIGPTGGHTGYDVTSNEALAMFFRMGYLGVPIFFVLSGYLIYYVSENRTPVDFGLNRFVRLMPAFWSALIFTLIVTSLFAGELTTPLTGLLANFTLVPQIFGFQYIDGVYWTLLYEFIFYFWFFVLLHQRAIYKHFYLICALWLAISFVNSLWFHNGLLERAYVTFYSGAFVAGMTLCRINSGDRGAKPIFLLCFSALSLSFGIQRLHIIDNIAIQYDAMPYLSGLLWSLMCIGVVAMCAQLRAPASWRSFCAMLGAISYPLYLIHQEAGYAILMALKGVASPAVASIFTALLALGSAYIIHGFCEEPLRRILKALAGKIKQSLGVH